MGVGEMRQVLKETLTQTTLLTTVSTAIFTCMYNSRLLPQYLLHHEASHSMCVKGKLHREEQEASKGDDGKKHLCRGKHVK